MTICKNSVLVVGIVAIASVSCVSILKGNNHILESFTAIVTLAGGAPHIEALYRRKSPDETVINT